MSRIVHVCALVLVIGAAVAGCSSLQQTENQQQFAGQTRIDVDCDPTQTAALQAQGNAVACVLDSLTVQTGKEYRDVYTEADLAAGTASFRPGEALAFDGQKFQAELEAFRASEAGKSIREITPQAIEALTRIAARAAGVPLP